MKTQYAILSPVTGTYTKVDDPKQVPALIAQAALDFYLAHTHQSPYTIINVNDDGSETWTSIKGEVLFDSVEAKKQLDLLIAAGYTPPIN